jgi:hypothetical protein
MGNTKNKHKKGAVLEVGPTAYDLEMTENNKLIEGPYADVFVVTRKLDKKMIAMKVPRTTV